MLVAPLGKETWYSGRGMLWLRIGLSTPKKKKNCEQHQFSQVKLGEYWPVLAFLLHVSAAPRRVSLCCRRWASYRSVRRQGEVREGRTGKICTPRGDCFSESCRTYSPTVSPNTRWPWRDLVANIIPVFVFLPSLRAPGVTVGHCKRNTGETF